MLDLRHDVVAIIKAGVTAPSIDNIQPWRFLVAENVIQVYLKPERNAEAIYYTDLSPLYVSHGALIENITIAADHYGYESEVSLFPDPANPHYVAKISLRYDPVDRGVNLFNFFLVRRTDRNNYVGCSLTADQKQTFLKAAESLNYNGRVAFIEKPQLTASLSKYSLSQLMIILTHKKTYTEFYSRLRWKQEEIRVARDGLDIRTFGLNIYEYSLFKYLFSLWQVMRAIAFLHIPSLIVLAEWSRFRNKESFIAIIAQGDTPVDYVESGRLMERIWLLGTRFGYALQPTSSSFFLARAHKVGKVNLPDAQVEELRTVTEDINRICGVNQSENLALLFRIGFGKKVPVKSERKEPEIIFD